MRISIIDGVPRRTLTSDELTQLLERFPLERAGGRPLEGTIEAQVQLLFGRIAALTEALRGTESNETTRLASRMLLVDLTSAAAYFRGRTNTMRSPLAKALAELRDLRHESSANDRP